MKKNQQPKNHHFVPICYLKNFTKDGKLSVLDIKKITQGIPHYVKTFSPKSICSFEDYYKIPSNELNEFFKLNSYNELYVESEVLKNL